MGLWEEASVQNSQSVHLNILYFGRTFSVTLTATG